MTAAESPDRGELRERLAELFLDRSSTDACIRLNGSGATTESYALDADHLAQHIAGRCRWGAIPYVDETRVGWSAVDLDVLKWGLDPDEPDTWKIVNAIIEQLALLGIRCALERSKGKGWHLWIIFDRPVPARDVRAFLRPIALAAGARDEKDLVCPRSDTRGDCGNGTWLPLYGGDIAPRTRFYCYDPDNEDWIEADDQAEFLREMIANPTPAELIPLAPKSADGGGAEPGERHPCTWIVEELRDLGIELHGVGYYKDKLRFQCPLHKPNPERPHDTTAVCWSDGHGHCSSTRCDAKWQTARRLASLIQESGDGQGKSKAEPLRVLTAEEFEADVAPDAIVSTLIYEGSTHSMNGASKAGKTWAAIQLSMAVNAGEPFLGLASVASPVLYLSFELSAGMLRERMREIEAATGIPAARIGDTFAVVAPTAAYVPRLDLGSHAGAAELERLIRETGARLVVLDTLYRFLPGVDVNDNGEIGEIFGRLNDIATRSGAALLLLDHVGKGDQLGPVSHSALGASVKGGAARVVIALRRTSRDDGGRWQIDVESHFGSWEEPVYYERPKRPDGTRAGGCVLCTASEAHGMKFATVHRLFTDYGEIDAKGHAFFASKRKMIEALEAAKLSSGNAQGQEIVAAMQRDYAIPEYLADRHPDRPILTSEGNRRAVIFTWRMAELPEDREWH